MKKRFLYQLLAVVSVILLIGLIASCGGSPEPQFKVIESREYTAANRDVVWAMLYDKHMNGKSSLSNPNIIMEPYWDNVWPLIRTEMGKMSSTAAGICVVLKVDTYKLLGQAFYKSDGGRSISYRLYNY